MLLTTGNRKETNKKLPKETKKQIKICPEQKWKGISEQIPIELHHRMILECYDCKIWDHFFNLSELMEIRLRLRRIEAPFDR